MKIIKEQEDRSRSQIKEKLRGASSRRFYIRNYNFAPSSNRKKVISLGRMNHSTIRPGMQKSFHLESVKENRSIFLENGRKGYFKGTVDHTKKRKKNGRKKIGARYMDYGNRLPEIRGSKTRNAKNKKGFFLRDKAKQEREAEGSRNVQRKTVGLGSEVIRQFVMESGDLQAMRYYTDLEKFYNKTQKLVEK